jgi:hypothetical protein
VSSKSFKPPLALDKAVGQGTAGRFEEGTVAPSTVELPPDCAAIQRSCFRNGCQLVVVKGDNLEVCTRLIAIQRMCVTVGVSVAVFCDGAGGDTCDGEHGQNTS